MRQLQSGVGNTALSSQAPTEEVEETPRDYHEPAPDILDGKIHQRGILQSTNYSISLQRQDSILASWVMYGRAGTTTYRPKLYWGNDIPYGKTAQQLGHWRPETMSSLVWNIQTLRSHHRDGSRQCSGIAHIEYNGIKVNHSAWELLFHMWYISGHVGKNVGLQK